MSDLDRQRARERIQKLKEEGTTIRQRLAKIKKHITSTTMTIDARHYHFDHNILDHGKNWKNHEQEKEQESRQKKELEYLIKCYKADKAKARNTSVDVRCWRSYDDIKSYLQPLKKEKEETWPKGRKGMESLYLKCFGRERYILVLDELVMQQWHEWKENKAIRAAAKGAN